MLHYACTIFAYTLKLLQDPDFISSYITNHHIKNRPNPPEIQRQIKEDDDDVIIVDGKGDKEKGGLKVKFKLLQFCENYRPAYYGTCQRLSKVISPRNPFKKDEVRCLICPGDTLCILELQGCIELHCAFHVFQKYFKSLHNFLQSLLDYTVDSDEEWEEEEPGENLSDCPSGVSVYMGICLIHKSIIRIVFVYGVT